MGNIVREAYDNSGLKLEFVADFIGATKRTVHNDFASQDMSSYKIKAYQRCFKINIFGRLSEMSDMPDGPIVSRLHLFLDVDQRGNVLSLGHDQEMPEDSKAREGIITRMETLLKGVPSKDDLKDLERRVGQNMRDKDDLRKRFGDSSIV